MAPWALIGIATLIGLLVRGLAGAALGALIGVALSFALGALVNIFQGGMLPRKVRRVLIVNLIAKHPEVVSRASPTHQGDRVFTELERVVESIGKCAVTHAAINADVWSETAVTLGLKDMIDDAGSEETKEL